MSCQKKSGSKVFQFSIFQNSKEHSAVLTIPLSKGSDCELEKIKMGTTTKRRQLVTETKMRELKYLW